MKKLLILILVSLTGCYGSRFLPSYHFETYMTGYRKLPNKRYELFFKAKDGRIDTINSATIREYKYDIGKPFLVIVDTSINYATFIKRIK